MSRRGNPVPPIGVHVSIAGGFQNAFAAGDRLACDCMQIFVKNQRQWHAPPLTDEQIALYRHGQRETGISPVVAHAGYLPNLASPDRRVRGRSVSAIADELDRCHALGISALVVHPGSYIRGSLCAGISRVARSLNEILRKCHGYGTAILLETTAGQGTSVGHRFEQLASIRALVYEPKRVGVCLDTCHVFAAGYDFRTPEKYRVTIDELDSVIGLAHVRCIHVNDSKRELGSRIDRHEHIGKGHIGKHGFAHFLNDPRLAHVPMILETPKGVDGRGKDFDKVNLKRLRMLIA